MLSSTSRVHLPSLVPVLSKGMEEDVLLILYEEDDAHNSRNRDLTRYYGAGGILDG